MAKETKTNHKPLPLAYIKEHLAICNESPSGLKWITRKRGRAVGPAGSPLGNGYHRVRLQGTEYLSHRIAHALHTGSDPGVMFIDHHDGDVANNRPDNLRLATHSQNGQNRKTQANNSSGVPGVAWDKQTSSWRGRVQLKGSPVISKRFKVLEDAAAWVAEKRLELFGEFSPKDHPGNPTETATAHPGPTQLGLFD